MWRESASRTKPDLRSRSISSAPSPSILALRHTYFTDFSINLPAAAFDALPPDPTSLTFVIAFPVAVARYVQYLREISFFLLLAVVSWRGDPEFVVS